MAVGIKLLPLQGISTDISPQLLKKEMARYVKNLYYALTDQQGGADAKGTELGVMKPLQANEVYCPIQLPAGTNTSIGNLPVRETKELYVFVHNSNSDHTIFRINGDRRSCTIVKTDPCFNFQLDPRYFIHESGAWMEVVTLIDPSDGATLIKKDIYWTDGFNPQGYIRTDDCIDTNGFDETQFPYFVGDYDRCDIFRMGLPPPKDCVKVVEVPIEYDLVETKTVTVFTVGNFLIITNNFLSELPQKLYRIVIAAGTPISGTYDVYGSTIGAFILPVTQLIVVNPLPTQIGFPGIQVTISVYSRPSLTTNKLLFNTWQFRLTKTDVFGRPSIYGIISDTYIPGVNDCLTVSATLPNCLDLSFDAGNPFTNTWEIAWRNCNEESWKTETTLFLYKGSNIGKWWLRERNTDLNYDPVTNKITYRFCRNKECTPIDVLTTNLLQPDLPRITQNIFPLNNLLANANNKRGFNPFSQDLLKKITAKIIPPNQSDDSRNITIYVAINRMDQQVMRRDGKYYFGGQQSGGLAVDLVEAKKQFFLNAEQSGFCGVLVMGDSSVAAISTQVYIGANGEIVDDPDLDGYNLSPSHRTLQKFVYTSVPKGCYRFYLTSAQTDPTREEGYVETSTPMWGCIPFQAVNDYYLDFTNRTAFPTTELFIDCCAADYDTLNDNKMLVIVDLAKPFLFSQCGYMVESDTDNTRWELLKVFQGIANEVSSLRTDANGFYWIYEIGDTNGAHLNISMAAYINCLRVGATDGVQVSSIDMVFKNYSMEAFFNGSPGYVDVVCNVTKIIGRLVLGSTGIGISGAIVSLTRGSTGQFITDANGYFEIIAHDDASNETPYGQRDDLLIINGGACPYVFEGNNCITATPIQIITCGITSPNVCSPRGLLLNTFVLSFKQEHSLLSGGVYPWFTNGYDWLGRKTYSQPLGDLIIPSMIKTQAIGASTVEVTIDPAATFPPETTYLTFSIGEETTIEKYLTWIVDRAEFINNKGEIDDVSPAQIKVYYQSLIEYNKVNNYNTTVKWQFIPDQQNPTQAATGDKVQFFRNGDGVWFTNDIVSLVKYDQEGTFFTIDYVSELKDLKPNALMRLIRPKNCTGEEVNYEVCKIVNVVNGKAQENTFILNAFDTYYLSRQIPVPAPVAPIEQTVLISNTTNTLDPTTNAILSSETIDKTPIPAPTVLELRSFGFRFEHDCPSNLWGRGLDGKGCANRGRVNSRNPYEAELIFQDEISFGGALSINGQLNYLQYFIPANRHSFKIPNTGGITYVRSKQGILLILTQYNNFTVGYGDNLPRVVDGVIVVPSGADTFGNPNVQISGNYGMQIWDKNTARERDGLVHFLDSSRVAILQHDFKNCEEISSNKTNPNRISTILSWLTKKLIYIKSYNNDPANVNKKYFLSVTNPVNNEYLISDFTIKGDQYVNEERDYAVDKHETMAFDIKASVWKGAYSSTPEMWGYLESELSGNQLFAFKGAIPYSYYKLNPTVFNTFFGVKCNRVFTPIVNIELCKKFKPLWLEVYCKQSGYFSDRIITEAGQESRILIGQFKQGEFMFSAPFLRDLNTLPDPNNSNTVAANPLFEGWPLYGTWVEVRMIGYPDFDDVYSALEGLQVFVIPETNTGLR